MRKLGVVLVSLLAGCSSSSPATDSAALPAGLELSLSTDLTTLDQLQIQADSGSSSLFHQNYARPTDGQLPGTLSFSPSNAIDIPAGSLSPGVALIVQSGVAMTLTITGTDSTTMKQVVRSVETTMPATVRSLSLKLEAACLGVSCESGQTCVAGACTSDAVDESTLAGAAY